MFDHQGHVQCGLSVQGDWWCKNALGHDDGCIPRIETPAERVARVQIFPGDQPPLEPPMLLRRVEQRWVDRIRRALLG